MGDVGRGAGTGSTSAPVSVKGSATARDGVSVTDTELLREALEALIAAARLLRSEATRLHDNLEPVQELRVLQVLNPTRAAITKLEERLLKEPPVVERVK
jgi:hypothetical protein